jgi:hypothetical protein
MYLSYEVRSYFAHVRLLYICHSSLPLVQQLFIVIVLYLLSVLSPYLLIPLPDTN